MKQFSLEEYLKDPSREIITRDGRKVRVVCTDKKGDYPIVALVEYYDGTNESDYSFKKDGRFYGNGDSNKDLFFAPEKHEGWINIYLNANRNYEGSCRIYKSKESAEEAIEGDSDYITTLKIEWEE